MSKQAISFLHPNLLVTARSTKVLLDQWRPAAATYRTNKKESVPRPDRITSNATGRQTACKQCTSSFSTQAAALPSLPPPPPTPRREPYARLLQFIVQRDHQMFRKIVLLSSSTTVVVFHSTLSLACFNLVRYKLTIRRDSWMKQMMPPRVMCLTGLYPSILWD